jgi:cytochrome bd-type quinol oxidase subunit 1
VPLNLFALPDEQAETDHYVISIPDLGSLILTHDPDGTVRGLKDFPADQRPPSPFPSSPSASWSHWASDARGRRDQLLAALEGRAVR